MSLLNVAVDPSLYTHYFSGKAYPHDMYRFLQCWWSARVYRLHQQQQMHCCKDYACNPAQNMNQNHQHECRAHQHHPQPHLNGILATLRARMMMNLNAVSMDTLQPKITRPIGWQWPPIDTPWWGLRYSSCAFFAVLLLQASRVTWLRTRTPLTLACTFSTAQDSSPKCTLCGIILFKLNTFFSHVFAGPQYWFYVFSAYVGFIGDQFFLLSTDSTFLHIWG